MDDFLKASLREDARPSHSSSLSSSTKRRVTPSQGQLSRAARLEDASHAPEGVILKIRWSGFSNLTTGFTREGSGSSGEEKSKSPQSRCNRALASRAEGAHGFLDLWSDVLRCLPGGSRQDEGCSVSAQGARGVSGCGRQRS